MCETCGCGQPDSQGVKILKPGAGDTHTHDEHSHDHDHDHHHDHDHPHHHRSHTHTETIQVQEDILGANNLVAARNRGYFEGRGIFALNLMSSPGAGKTTLLERTIQDISPGLAWAVIEGDQQTTMDADRIDAAGAEAIQVNTGTGCHLDARMIREALAQLAVPEGAVLAIENVGNLANARRVNPDLIFISLSAKTGEGLEGWYDWVRENHRAAGAGNVSAKEQ